MTLSKLRIVMQRRRVMMINRLSRGRVRTSSITFTESPTPTTLIAMMSTTPTAKTKRARLHSPPTAPTKTPRAANDPSIPIANYFKVEPATKGAGSESG